MLGAEHLDGKLLFPVSEETFRRLYNFWREYDGHRGRRHRRPIVQNGDRLNRLLLLLGPWPWPGCPAERWEERRRSG